MNTYIIDDKNYNDFIDNNYIYFINIKNDSELFWNQYIIYSILINYKIHSSKINIFYNYNKILNGNLDIYYISNSCFLDLIKNKVFEINILLDNITILQRLTLQKFMNMNDNIIYNIYYIKEKNKILKLNDN